MSGPFSSPSPFGTNHNFNSNYTSSSYESNEGNGLRQRHSANPSGAQDENSNPNNFFGCNAGKWTMPSSMQQNKVAAQQPPRLRIASNGNALGRATNPIAQKHLVKEPTAFSEHLDHLRKIVPEKQNDLNDLSLWVVVFGFRSQHEFREVFRAMKNIGKINAQLGGFSAGAGMGENWAALQYESHIAAEKALARKQITIPDTRILIGVIPLRKVAAELGISLKNGSMPSLENISKLRAFNCLSKMHGLNSEDDVLLIEGERDDAMDHDDVVTQMNTLCGKVLSWFFMWDSNRT
mmetsp:Transcript_30251/g.64853  ORF Transcript_30251/g.64853 Transcript_30251/m.64853 type:complete len:293 (-) Transcript_30251:194-1072(-)